MKPRWRVQAILLPSPAGPSEPYWYAASYYRWKWQAWRQATALRRSFARGHATIVMVREW